MNVDGWTIEAAKAVRIVKRKRGIHKETGAWQ